MNFSDFGVKDETELEQDEFSLSRPTFGKDKQLTVIGWKGKSSDIKCYIVKCSKCSKDPEMFGDGIFKASKIVLTKGIISCGCSRCHKWTETQYIIRIKRLCNEKGYIFKGFAEDFKGSQTKLKLECPTHGYFVNINIGNFMKSPCGCPACNTNKKSIRATKNDEVHINNFMSTGKYKTGSKFWRSDRLNSRGYSTYWLFKCPVCSNDEYVKAGLCSGVFEVLGSDLLCGKTPCRCSPSYYWTKDQYEYRIKKKMQESKLVDKFIGFVDGYKNANSKFIRFCKIHGNYETGISKYLDKNCGCPACANQNQQECYINLIKDNDSVIALKFGIAKDSKQRIKRQGATSSFDVQQYGVWSFPDVKSCKAAEKFIKQNLKCKVLTKQEMPDGYTETTSVENLEAIIKIYEDFGGVCKSLFQ